MALTQAVLPKSEVKEITPCLITPILLFAT